MKILLSAYACEPGKGSEPYVGWHWANTLAKLGHETWVITRRNNQDNIYSALKNIPIHEQPKFIFYDLPNHLHRWKKGERGIHLYYFLWQWGAYRQAKKIHKQESFEHVHHVTFAGIRQPSFMGNLNIPFTFGPLGGGERAPFRLRRGYSLRGQIADILRDIVNVSVKFNPFLIHSFEKALRIYVTSEQTKKLIPRRYWDKTFTMLAIGWQQMPISFEISSRLTAPELDLFRILYVGQFTYWKGMHLGLMSFAHLLKYLPNARLTMVGQGLEEAHWKKMALKLGINAYIDWIPWVDRKLLPKIYISHHVFLYPSLHDSGGLVVLEAMSHGLPVICLDIGGPGVMVNNSCGYVVCTKESGVLDIQRQLAEHLFEIANNDFLRNTLSGGAIERSEAYSWEQIIKTIHYNGEN